MIKIYFVFIAILYTVTCTGQSNSSLVPDNTSNFRFIGDTTKHCSEIRVNTYYDSLKNVYYYKAESCCVQKIWTKQYGYTKIWWVDFDSNSWTSTWQMGYYWSYIISTENKEVMFYDLTLKSESIKRLNTL